MIALALYTRFISPVNLYYLHESYGDTDRDSVGRKSKRKEGYMVQVERGRGPPGGGEHRVTRGSILYQCSGYCCYFCFLLSSCLLASLPPFLASLVSTTREKGRKGEKSLTSGGHSEGLGPKHVQYFHVHAYKSRYRDKPQSWRSHQYCRRKRTLTTLLRMLGLVQLRGQLRSLQGLRRPSWTLSIIALFTWFIYEAC
ncbi:hypothetical protein KQX54_007355 [Cotesia glomerata]|uniref:Uncharacterized protein n=1 Tax=Cotesia glomerata TaxID=32391 RepID=A0AAV7IIA0_COTGL|nr:hypothetical protein KQX54_007355 [Cotesia glomerata]